MSPGMIQIWSLRTSIASPGPLCRMTEYLVVSPNGRFSVGKEMGTLVHQFDPSCEAGVAELAKAISAKIPVRFFVTPEAVGRAYEHNVPWCQDCCLGDLV